jgi:hypothetical protein
MKYLSQFIAAGLVVAVATSAAALAQVGQPEQIAAKDAQAVQTSLADSKGFDLSVVFVARVMVDGTRHEFTSLQPEVLGHAGAGDSQALSLVRFNEEKTALVLFTRNPKSGGASRLVIPVATLEKKPHFTFPVVTDDGKLATRKFEVLEVKHLP